MTSNNLAHFATHLLPGLIYWLSTCWNCSFNLPYVAHTLGWALETNHIHAFDLLLGGFSNHLLVPLLGRQWRSQIYTMAPTLDLGIFTRRYA